MPPFRSHQQVPGLLRSLLSGLLIPNSPPGGEILLLQPFPQLLWHSFLQPPVPPHPALLPSTMAQLSISISISVSVSVSVSISISVSAASKAGAQSAHYQAWDSQDLVGKEQKPKFKATKEGRARKEHSRAGSEQHCTRTAPCRELLLRLSTKRRERRAFSLPRGKKLNEIKCSQQPCLVPSVS